MAPKLGLIHIEYGFALAGTLDYLKIWLSLTRGHWLVSTGCQHPHSTVRASALKTDTNAKVWHTFWNSAMQHQNMFVLPPNLDRQGLLQITPPTQEESAAAAASVNELFDRLGSALAEPVLA